MPYFSASETSTPPLRRAVELGHDDAGDADHVAEGLGLGVGVLADRRVEHQQHRMRRRGIDLLQHAHDLLQLGHQVGLVVQPPGRVDQQDVGARRPRASTSASKASPAASAPVGRVMTGAPVRSPQIWSCSTAAARKVSPAAMHHALALVAVLLGELADRRRLAAAVDADTSITNGFGARVEAQRPVTG